MQRWITYRDESVKRLIVDRSPLYPISSLMLHGIVFGDADSFATQVMPSAEEAKDPERVQWDFACQAWSFFATGANLQELYLTPRLMSAPMWAEVGAAAKWAQRSAAQLWDAHWIAGDAHADEAYGWAGFDTATGVGYFALRNPKNRDAAAVDVDPSAHLELPGPGRWRCAATLAWGKTDPRMHSDAPPTALPEVACDAVGGSQGGCHWKVELPPHQVVVYDVDCVSQ